MFLWRRKTTAARRRYTLQKQKKRNLYSPALEFLQDSWKVLYPKSHGSILNTSHLKGLDQLGDRRGIKKRRRLFVEDSEKLLQNSKQPQQQQKQRCEYHSRVSCLKKNNTKTNILHKASSSTTTIHEFCTCRKCCLPPPMCKMFHLHQIVSIHLMLLCFLRVFSWRS